MEQDRPMLEDIRLAYAQAGTITAPEELPSSVDEARRRLRHDFVTEFIDRLAEINVDVIRLSELTTAYSFLAEARPVVAIKATGNWFHENWSLAHELGHLVLGHRGVLDGTTGYERDEAAANAFAAELLLPHARMQAVDWTRLHLADLAELVWETGTSTDALRRRLSSLHLECSSEVAAALTMSTQKLLRHHWTGARYGDPITKRMTAATRRSFPSWLHAAHLEQIAAGKIGKRTLAWMLEVDAGSLQVDEPEPTPSLSGAALEEMLGCGETCPPGVDVRLGRSQHPCKRCGEPGNHGNSRPPWTALSIGSYAPGTPGIS
ncbi:ImmA/IrrE family metallo-endopeptidase [Brachybacterium sp. AOP3-A1-3]|uniref:ImmA/IrrE family metallo-endopeptidase n=1 Tax=Brachybacterium sp. AOP3-A1-3 TaxID=3457699 RepID=UPI00403419E6